MKMKRNHTPLLHLFWVAPDKRTSAALPKMWQKCRMTAITPRVLECHLGLPTLLWEIKAPSVLCFCFFHFYSYFKNNFFSLGPKMAQTHWKNKLRGKFWRWESGCCRVRISSTVTFTETEIGKTADVEVKCCSKQQNKSWYNIHSRPKVLLKCEPKYISAKIPNTCNPSYFHLSGWEWALAKYHPSLPQQTDSSLPTATENQQNHVFSAHFAIYSKMFFFIHSFNGSN